MAAKKLKKDAWKKYLGDADSQEYDVDHIANLIFNELFKLNYSGKGFLNTCAECNRTFKSEKLWSPSIELWLALIYRAANHPEFRPEGEPDIVVRYDISTLMANYPWPGGLVTTDEGGARKGGIPGWHGGENSKPKGGYKTYTSVVSHEPKNLPEPYKSAYEACMSNKKKNNNRRALFIEGQGIYNPNSSNPSGQVNKKMIMEGEAIILDRFALIFKENPDYFFSSSSSSSSSSSKPGAKKSDDVGSGKNDDAIRQQLVEKIFRAEDDRLNGIQGQSGAIVLSNSYMRMISIYPVIASYQYAQNLEAQALAAGKFNPRVAQRLVNASSNFYIPLLGASKKDQQDIDSLLYRSFIATANGLNTKELFEIQKFSEERSRTAEDGISMLPMTKKSTSAYSKKFNDLLFPTKDTTHFDAVEWFETNVQGFMKDKLAAKRDFLTRVDEDPGEFSYNDYLRQINLGPPSSSLQLKDPNEYKEKQKEYEARLNQFLENLVDFFNNSDNQSVKAISTTELLFCRDLYDRANKANIKALRDLAADVRRDGKKYQEIKEQAEKLSEQARIQVEELKELMMSEYKWIERLAANGQNSEAAFQQLLAEGKKITYINSLTGKIENITSLGQFKSVMIKLNRAAVDKEKISTSTTNEQNSAWFKKFSKKVKKQISNYNFYMRIISLTLAERERIKFRNAPGSDSESDVNITSWLEGEKNDDIDNGDGDASGPNPSGSTGKDGVKPTANSSSGSSSSKRKRAKDRTDKKRKRDDITEQLNKNPENIDPSTRCMLPPLSLPIFQSYFRRYRAYYNISHYNSMANSATLKWRYNPTIPSNIRGFQKMIIMLRMMLVYGMFDNTMPEVLSQVVPLTERMKYPIRKSSTGDRIHPPFRPLLKPHQVSDSLFWYKMQGRLKTAPDRHGNYKYVDPFMDEVAAAQPQRFFLYPEKDVKKYGKIGYIYKTERYVMYWWDQSDIMAALVKLCPRGQWSMEQGSFTTNSTTYNIRINNKVTLPDGSEISTVRIIGNGRHWKVFSRRVSNGNIGQWVQEREINPSRMPRGGHHFSGPLHRVGGDCGPSAVIMAIHATVHDREMSRQIGRGRTRKNRKKRRQTKNKRKNKHKTKKNKRKKNKTHRKR